MINGFERETAPLDDFEKTLIKPFINGLKTHVGKNNAVTSKKIIVGIQKNLGKKINDARVRKIINHIRREGLVRNLIASSKGYYIENNIYELRQYITSLEQRAQAIQDVANALRKQNQMKVKQTEMWYDKY